MLLMGILDGMVHLVWLFPKLSRLRPNLTIIQIIKYYQDRHTFYSIEKTQIFFINISNLLFLLIISYVTYLYVFLLFNQYE
jgi:hypothetical protein